MKSSAILKVVKGIRSLVNFNWEVKYQASQNMNKVICWLFKSSSFKITSKIFHKILIFTFNRHMGHKPWKLACHSYYLPYAVVLLPISYTVTSEKTFFRSPDRSLNIYLAVMLLEVLPLSKGKNIIVLSCHSKAENEMLLQFPVLNITWIMFHVEHCQIWYSRIIRNISSCSFFLSTKFSWSFFFV